MTLTLKINGQDRPLDVDPDTPLLWALRDALGNNRTYKWWIVAESADGVKAGAKFKFKTNFS